MTKSEYQEFYTRWLLAKRTYPKMDVGQPPKWDICDGGEAIRKAIHRDVERTF